MKTNESTNRTFLDFLHSNIKEKTIHKLTDEGF